MAEWSKAPDSSSGPRERAWVQIPLLTLFSGFFFIPCIFLFLFLQISFPLTILHFPFFSFSLINTHLWQKMTSKSTVIVLQVHLHMLVRSFIGRGDRSPRFEFFFKFIFCTYLKQKFGNGIKAKYFVKNGKKISIFQCNRNNLYHLH